MTSLPVSGADVAGRRVAAPMLVLRLLLLLLLGWWSVQPAGGCILLLDGWSPMSVAERATLADIVAVGTVHRTFQTDRGGDDATYSAEVRIVDVFKGRRLVDAVPYRPETHRSTSGLTRSQHTNSSGIRLSLIHI